MAHLACLIASTKAQVIFISETRNAKMTKTSLINRFNNDDAFVALAQGLSRGLWLLWNDEIEVNVIDSCANFYLDFVCS